MDNYFEIKDMNGNVVRIPKIVYKYRDWENEYHKKILLENKIYFASPKDFEDPKDCNPPVVFPKLEEVYDYFLTKSKKDNPNYTRQNHRAYARKLSKKSPLADPKRRDAEWSRLNELFKERFGVFSVTTDAENSEMWKKYSDDSRGICIGFDMEKLYCGRTAGSGVEVKYYDELPVINFSEDSNKEKHCKTILCKESKWSFEKEYRLSKFFPNPASSDERNRLMPFGTIVEIILGKNISDEHKQEITDLVNNQYPHIIIKQSKV